MLRELVVVSGKGGTGKTSLAASLAVLSEGAAIADCDVDAADLHLLLRPRPIARHGFRAGVQASIREADCIRCGACRDACRFSAIGAAFRVDPIACEGCGVCARVCPAGAVDLEERVCGEWMISETRCGPMAHARLAPGAENSGKLVSLVRLEARRLAEEAGHDWIIVDGPPGIGCPVIASITGATHLLAVTEPTVAGEHDLDRVVALAAHFGVPAALCVNKWDINPEVADRIEARGRAAQVEILPRIRYDSAVTAAQLREQAVVETDGAAAEDVRRVWAAVKVWSGA